MFEHGYERFFKYFDTFVVDSLAPGQGIKAVELSSDAHNSPQSRSSCATSRLCLPTLSLVLLTWKIEDLTYILYSTERWYSTVPGRGIERQEPRNPRPARRIVHRMRACPRGPARPRLARRRLELGDGKGGRELPARADQAGGSANARRVDTGHKLYPSVPVCFPFLFPKGVNKNVMVGFLGNPGACRPLSC